MAVPATVVYYTTYDQLKYAWGYNEKDPKTQYIPAAAGCTARSKSLAFVQYISFQTFDNWDNIALYLSTGLNQIWYLWHLVV